RRDPLLLLPRGAVGQLREDDLAREVPAGVVLEGTCTDRDELAAQPVVGRAQAVAERVRPDRQLDRLENTTFRLLREAHQPRAGLDTCVNTDIEQRLTAVLRHPAGVLGPREPRRDATRDPLDMIPDRLERERSG